MTSLSITFSLQDILESIPADGRDAGAGAGADSFLPAILPVQPRREHVRRYRLFSLALVSLVHSQCMYVTEPECKTNHPQPGLNSTHWAGKAELLPFSGMLPC